MLKAIIYTIDSANFGNKLQNYALEATLNKLKVSTYTLRHQKYNLKYFLQLILSPIKKKKNKWYSFMRFRKKIKWSKECISQKKVWQKINSRYDFVIVGSDQVWNTEFCPDGSFFLPNILPQKRIAFAASFGTEKIDYNYESFIKNNLSNFANISVREFSGAKIIYDLINKNIPVLLDPTMLLTIDEWISLEHKPIYLKKKSKKYILLYFLGCKTEKILNITNRIKLKYDLDVIDISEKNNNQEKNIGPSEFIFLIHNAELILTDSFHGCVFSFIFNKSFYLADRVDSNVPNMTSRTQTLFRKLNLANRNIDNFDINYCMCHDYRISYQLLNKEREKSINFLKSALKI